MPKVIYVAGHNGMVGSAIVRRLQAGGAADQVIVTRTRAELDLADQQAVTRFFTEVRVDEVYLAAARVGGIYANNTYPAAFIADNLAIQGNVIGAAHQSGVRRLLFLGSSCIYPRMAPQPIRESALLTGPLEPTNAPYAIAKIAGIIMCDSYNRQYRDDAVDYRCVMPTNLFGPGDNYHPENAHVIPSLIARFHRARLEGAREVVIWGTGTPLRDFLHVDDMAAACVFAMDLPRAQYHPADGAGLTHINVGSGQEISIMALAQLVASVVGYDGEIVPDPSKPDGTPRKLLDVSLLERLGWRAAIGLRAGLEHTYLHFLQTASLRS